MELEIGRMAGTIWQYLNQHGPSTLATLKRETRAPEPLLHMALGWLAREGNIDLLRDKRSLRVSLR